MKCPICKAQALPKGIVPGYVAGTWGEVSECSECETQFIRGRYDKAIYEVIYSAQGSFGYERYGKYVEEIKKQDDPLHWLSLKEPAYLYVQPHLKQEKLKILEVGCGDGYLTYAMNQAGHVATGIDISEEAISVAKRSFGDFYQAKDLKDFVKLYDFDLIVCTEIIEHLADPVLFVAQCKALLKKGGQILLTTPNKDYRSPNTIWQTEAPPVHRFWLGHKSFEAIAKKNGMTCEFLSCVMPMDMERNNVVAYYSSRGSNKFGSVLDKDGKVFPSNPSKIRKLLRDFFMWTPIRYFCNGLTLYVTKIKEAPTLGVLLS
jgi:2-polyprenyl-3-methyl-5-hydroxy-6-metoxy-1,4-benzoquinol methylase